MADDIERSLLRRLKREMNGAVVEAMEKRGIIYPLNYGVSIPTIKSIVVQYAPDHELALRLFRSDIRELMLAALFIDDPSMVTAEQMSEWGRKFTNYEIVENTASKLFSKSPQAPAIALEWIGSEDKMLCYAGLLTAAGTMRINPRDIDYRTVEDFIDSAAEVPYRSDFDLPLSHGVVTLMERCARHSSDACSKVRGMVAKFNASDNNLIRHTAGELSWRLEII